MLLKARSHTSFAIMTVLALCVGSSGCTGQIEDGEPLVDTQVDALEGSVWTFCANARNYCVLPGERTVRYGRDGRYVEAKLSGRVYCARTSFPSGTLYRGGNSCYYDANSGSGGVVSGGGTSGGGTASGGTTSGGTTSGGAMMGMGPHIDVSAIPAGDPGVSEVMLRPTTEKPGPTDGTGAFRTVCNYSHMSFDDPIVYPGKKGAAHLHTFFGNTLTDAFSTTDSLRNSGNSTCRGGIVNRSAYWVPSVVDGAGKPLAPEIGHIYYKTGYAGIDPAAVQPFPRGLRVLAGDPKATSRQPHAFWTCLNTGAQSGSIPSCSPGDRAIMNVFFPQCWDGKNVDSTDHRSHMAYPKDGACPATHPVAIPEVSYHFYYIVPAGGTSGWRLSSDMYDASLPGGYSLHGDWFAAWDDDAVRAFVRNCENPARDCHSHLLGDGREMLYPWSGK